MNSAVSEKKKKVSVALFFGIVYGMYIPKPRHDKKSKVI